MSKKKNSMALFEVLSQDSARPKMGVPEWMQHAPDEAETPPADETRVETENETDDTTSEADPPLPDENVEPETPAGETDETAARQTELPADRIAPAVPNADDDNLYENADDTENAIDVDEPTTGPVACPPPMHRPLEATATPEPAPASIPVPHRPTYQPTWKRVEDVEPSFSRRGNELRIHIGMLAAMFWVGVILIVVVASFVLGRLTAPDGPPGPEDQAGKTPAGASNIARSGHRDATKQYLLIQQLESNTAADRAQANQIITFCRARSLPADQIKIQSRAGGPKRIAVWSLRGYSDKKSPEAIAHVQAVETAGQAYYRKYGRYRFSQRNATTGAIKPQFISGKYDVPKP